jgi:triacylglycerol lipase
MLRHPDTRDTMNPLLWLTTSFAGGTLDDHGRLTFSPADGMVSVESAKWGRFRGCLPADHYDVIGQIAHTTPDPMTGFDSARFFAAVVTSLASRGF